MTRIRMHFATLKWVCVVSTLLVTMLFLQTGVTMSFAEETARNYTGEQLFRGLIFCHGEVADLIPEIRDNLEISTTLVTADQLKLIEAAQDRIIAAINDTSPQFFDQFGQMIRSGDQVTVNDALDLASQTILAAVRAMPEVQQFKQAFESDPQFADQILDEFRNSPNANAFTPEELDDAVTAALAGIGIGGNDPLTSIAVVFVAIGAVILAFTFFVFSAYGTVINIGAAVNVVAAIVFTAGAWVTVTSGIAVDKSMSLLHEEIVNSIAQILAR